MPQAPQSSAPKVAAAATAGPPTFQRRVASAGPAIKMICPNLRCRTILSVPAAARGKMVRCKSCTMRINVPAAG